MYSCLLIHRPVYPLVQAYVSGAKAHCRGRHSPLSLLTQAYVLHDTGLCHRRHKSMYAMILGCVCADTGICKTWQRVVRACRKEMNSGRAGRTGCFIPTPQTGVFTCLLHLIVSAGDNTCRGQCTFKFNTDRMEIFAPDIFQAMRDQRFRPGRSSRRRRSAKRS